MIFDVTNPKRVGSSARAAFKSTVFPAWGRRM
jgi:hypothetical protein